MGLPSSLCGGDSVCRCGEPACENVALTRIIVGASLLAKALGQAMMKLNVPTPSRASPLPQGFGLD